MPQSRRSKTTKTKPSNRPTVASLKKTMLASGDPNIRAMAPHIAGGMRIVHYLFDAIEAASKVKAPRGIKLGAVECYNRDNDPKAYEEMKAALWAIEMVKQQIGYEEKAKD